MKIKLIKALKQVLFFALCITAILQFNTHPWASAGEKGRDITILFTHDLHDNLLPFKTIENGTSLSVGGYARLQSAINAQKELDPEALLVDGGDFSMGTPFQTIFQSDAPELRIMGAMGYEVVTLGNHEFDYRPVGLAGSLQAALASKEKLPQMVLANMTYPTDKEGNLTPTLTELKQAMEDYGLKDYTIIEKKGVKIGIFGLEGKESASMAPMSEVVFTDPVKEAKRVVKILKEQEKVDLILCLSHSGTYKDKSKSEDEILAKKVPEIDVIISGHTHTRLEEPIVIGDTIIASAESYGKYLGVIKLYENSKSGWNLDTYELVRINDSFPEDGMILNRINEFKEVVQEKYFDKFDLLYDEVVATSDMQFQTLEELSTNHGESPLGNLLSDAYIYAVKNAEGENYEPIAAAIVPYGTIRGTVNEGEITTADAFSISSLGVGADGMPGYPLISVYLTGKELKTVCEVDASIAPIMDVAQLFMSGMNFTFNPNRLIFNKVVDSYLLLPDGSREEIKDKELYRVVCGLYSAQMLSIVGDKSYGLMSIVPKTKDGEVITDYEKQIIYNSVDGSELKEWYAIVRYLQSFDEVNGVSKIPPYYSELQGRKVVNKSKNLLDLISNPNGIALTVYIAVPVIFLALAFVIYKISKRIRKRKAGKQHE